MTDAKKKRLIISVTIGAILLVLILLSVMIYQIISLSVESAKEKELNNLIIEYQQKLEECEDEIARRELYEWLEREANKLGYTDIDDKIFGTN